MIFIIEPHLSVFDFGYRRAVFSTKEFRCTLATSFLQFIQFLIRLSGNVSAGAEKSGNRNADSRSHFQLRTCDPVYVAMN